MINISKSCLWPTFYRGYIRGQVESCVLFDTFPKDILCQLLPPGYRLARQVISPPGMHPVYWCCNLNQHNVGTPIPLLCLNYHEFAFVIPYVRCTAENSPLGAYSPALYLNSLPGVAGGKIIYQLEKTWKRCTLTAKSFTNDAIGMKVRRLLHDEEIITASFEKSGKAIPYLDSKNLMLVKPMLDQPLLTSGWQGNKSSKFILDYENAEIQPLESSIQTKNFLNGLENLDRKIHSIEKSPFGGFYFNIPWRLDLPKS